MHYGNSALFTPLEETSPDLRPFSSYSFNVVSSYLKTDRTDAMGTYSKLLRLKLTEAQLRQQNYPRPHPSISGKAQLHNMANSVYKVMPSGIQRNCKRCSKVYAVGRDGTTLTKESCSYHPYRVGGGRAPIHRCCGRGLGAPPCRVASQHISEDIDPNNLVGFVSTKDNHVGSESAYALDCEMVCTKAGLELAAITVVDVGCNVVYETMVLPHNPIIDYLTEYSNLTSRDFIGVTTRIEDVHKNILKLIGRETILVGHGMEHDFLAIKLLHDNVVDTIVAYPHARGRGFRNSLSFLKERFLPRSFTTAGRGGLKSKEDAIAVMKLALLKCK
ncbi:putative exonuclease GOR [Palaemon carinicauda]|uniref:putative exonuclease GOR n=1 Tax=Palaemon carinicauda TaxID=392227 RepID=UPI0035B64813